jgi:hypothetical protein
MSTFPKVATVSRTHSTHAASSLRSTTTGSALAPSASTSCDGASGVREVQGLGLRVQGIGFRV